MTNPESPDYAALIKDWEWFQTKLGTYEMEDCEVIAKTNRIVDDVDEALRALLKERDERPTPTEAKHIRHDRDEALKSVYRLQSKLEQCDKALAAIGNIYDEIRERIRKP